jgi:hypothetical protein
MFGEFVKFLSSFEYGECAMCVLTEVVPLWQFIQPEALPVSMHKLRNSMEQMQESLPVRKCATEPFGIDAHHNL